MLPSLVTKNDTVPWGTVAWSTIKPMEPRPILVLPWPPIIGPPIFVRETFTTVPGSFGALRGEPERNPCPPGPTPPRRAPTATAPDATRAITAAASAPTSRGRRAALTSGLAQHP